MPKRLKVIYEDNDIIVEMGPHDNEIPDLIMDYFKQERRPLTWQRLREHFSATIGEDRLRRALRNLVNEGRLVQLNRNTYADPETLDPHVIEELEAKWRITGRRRGAGYYRSPIN